ncbi:MAG: ABC transporter permease, partial [Rudaea sp.]
MNRRVVVKTVSTPPSPEKKSVKASRPPLRAWREQHFYSFFSSLGRLAARPWATTLTLAVLSLALAFPLLF